MQLASTLPSYLGMLQCKSETVQRDSCLCVGGHGTRLVLQFSETFTAWRIRRDPVVPELVSQEHGSEFGNPCKGGGEVLYRHYDPPVERPFGGCIWRPILLGHTPHRNLLLIMHVQTSYGPGYSQAIISTIKSQKLQTSCCGQVS